MNIPARLLGFVEARSRATIGSACAVTIAILSVIDYMTGEHLSIAVFYLAPISVAAWRLGLRRGVVLALAAALVSTLADGLHHDTPMFDSGLTYWNFFAHGGIFLSATLTMSMLRRALAAERELARSDTLTDGANRRSFEEAAETELRRGRRYGYPLTCAYIDVDDLKLVNDNYGHHQGDELLRTVAQVLRNNVRETDLVARLGGDEFCVLLPQAGEQAAEVVIAKLHGALRAAADSALWPLSASIGAVAFTTMPSSLDEMIKLADDVMYGVKTAGKNAARLVAA